jgi:hypothetical protein
MMALRAGEAGLSQWSGRVAGFFDFAGSIYKNE